MLDKIRPNLSTHQGGSQPSEELVKCDYKIREIPSPTPASVKSVTVTDMMSGNVRIKRTGGHVAGSFQIGKNPVNGSNGALLAISTRAKRRHDHVTHEDRTRTQAA